jgi:hypothetical protein
MEKSLIMEPILSRMSLIGEVNAVQLNLKEVQS